MRCTIENVIHSSCLEKPVLINLVDKFDDLEIRIIRGVERERTELEIISRNVQ